MDINKELHEISESLSQMRDELVVQIHLAGMDAKTEWEKAEKKREEFIETLGVITDDTRELSSEVLQATKVIGDELVDTYQRISERLKK